MDTAKLVGEQIDQYRILSHIDRGGMADVYLAEDVDLERKVAFKVMLDMLALDKQYVRRFRREARTVARLDHPNIVQVYSTGQTPLGQPYIAMQYIDGGSLRDKLIELAERKKLLTTEQVLNIVRQVAVALGVAHKAQVVHRDLKPGNVLIRPDGTPVLVDLGIAAVRTEAKLTHTGGFMGTPAYMSPEQIRSLPLDGRSDLYSLGIMFYELFAGNRPFDAADVTGIMYKQVHEEAIPLQSLRPDLSSQTLLLVETLLKKEPEQRYETAEMLVPAIDHAIRAEGGHNPNPQVTQVLTQLEDSKLISRGGVLRAVQKTPQDKVIAAEPAARRRIPAWIIVTLLMLVAIIIGFVFLSSEDRFGLLPPTAVPRRPSEDDEQEEEVAEVAPEEVATVTATATVPPTATSTETAVPSPTITATATETAVPSATSTSPPIATA
ncbi:MAG: serine/threonine protein kinase, partial [Chloroflexi bacterium]|nr:serine/threonine protein kinase [Chloroflexota bacterium]